MNKFFQLIIDTNVSDYARPNENFYKQSLGKMSLVEAYRNQQIQFFSRQPEKVELDEGGGLIFPDFMFYERVLLVSESAFNVLRETYFLFEKQVILTFDALGLQEKFHLLLPPKIRSTNVAGNYSVFSLETNQLVAEATLCAEIERAGLENVYFNELKEDFYGS